MAVRKPPISPCASIDPETAPIDPVREGSSVIYFCSAEEIGEGFAIALRAMGFEEVLLLDLTQPGTTSNPEDA
jgi:hypothetical protein